MPELPTNKRLPGWKWAGPQLFSSDIHVKESPNKDKLKPGPHLKNIPALSHAGLEDIVVSS